MAVEFYKGEWVLRARLPTDLPAHLSAAAQQAMTHWRESNRAKFQTSGDSAAQ
jgi:hypothetical protein